MSTISTIESIKELEKYDKKEFYCLINLFDNKELINPIKKYNKKFSQDTKGWRIDKLDKNKLKEIYYKYVFNKINANLCINFVNLIKKTAKELKEILELNLGNIEDISKEVKNNNKDYIDKIIDILLESKYSENILISFKLLDIELDQENISHINETIRFKKSIKEEKNKVISMITVEFERKLKEAEKNFNETLKNKEKEIKDLKLNIDSINKKHAIDIGKKEIEVYKLKDNISFKENKFNQELKKLNNNIKNLEQSLDKYVVTIEEEKKISEQKEEEISRLLHLLEERYGMYSDYAKSRWKEENAELQSKNEEMLKNIRDLEVHKQCIEEEVFMLKKDKENIKNAIKSLEDDSKDFISNISYVMDRIGNVHVSEVNTKESNYETISSINHIPSKIVEQDPEVKEDVYGFINDLADNFEYIGIGNDYNYNLAKYVYATIANRMGLFTMGYNNRLFADAISYTICNSSADTILIPPGFTDSKQLVNLIKDMKSRVVIIENAIDNISESVYMALLKENKDKILIFSMESNENINILPKSIFNYLMAIDLDYILEGDQVDTLDACITPDKIFKIDKNNKNNKIKRKRLLRNLSKIIDLGHIAKIKLLEINDIINSLDSEKNVTDGIYSLLLFSLGTISKSQCRSESINEFIREQNFDSEKLDIMEFVIGMEEQNE